LKLSKNAASPARAGRAAPIQAGEFLPPSAAKNVRTIFKIVHQRGNVKFASPASAGSATKL